MTKVFVSYSRRDDGSVHKISNALRESGIDVWTDNQIPLGVGFDDAIRRSVQQSDFVLVVVTPDLLQSEWIDNEIGLAQQFNRPIVSVLMEGTTPSSLPPSLQGVSLVDAREGSAASFKELTDMLLAKNGVSG